MGRILAVDWGARRIGLALSDPGRVLASGLPTLPVRRRADAVARVAETARAHQVERIVVGLPLLLSGERGEAAREAQQFADALAAASGIPVETYDERLTSALSLRRLHDAGRRVGRDKGRVDQGAAVALLESFLERLRSRAADDEGTP